MHRLLSLGCTLAVVCGAITSGTLARAAPPSTAPPALAIPLQVRPGAGFHPFKASTARWQQGRALRKLEQVVLAKPRIAIKFEERYGKIGGKNQFASRGPLAMLGIGTAVNLGGFIQSDQLVPYLVAGAVVDLSAFATHVIGTRRQRRKAIVSMIEDGTISSTDLHPFRKALGMTDKGHHIGSFPIFTR